ncbi:MAG: hypothetical protein MRY21_04830 [Simkaniaceae bacterium]|nr:hypothetical protein [Simkaniaceae bacterium]
MQSHHSTATATATTLAAPNAKVAGTGTDAKALAKQLIASLQQEVAKNPNAKATPPPEPQFIGEMGAFMYIVLEALNKGNDAMSKDMSASSQFTMRLGQIALNSQKKEASDLKPLNQQIEDLYDQIQGASGDTLSRLSDQLQVLQSQYNATKLPDDQANTNASNDVSTQQTQVSDLTSSIRNLQSQEGAVSQMASSLVGILNKL